MCVCVCLYSRFLIVAWFAQICVITVLVQSFAWVGVEGDLVVKVCMCDRERERERWKRWGGSIVIQALGLVTRNVHSPLVQFRLK